jgi:coenzyme F420-dependent glucose-6-phosphate dehydrogenase
VRYGYKAFAEQFGARELADFSLPAEARGLDPLELERLADAHPERAASRFIVSNDPDEVVGRIAPYVDLGFNELVFHGPGEDQGRFLELFTSDVLPRLRRRFG